MRIYEVTLYQGLPDGEIDNAENWAGTADGGQVMRLYSTDALATRYAERQVRAVLASLFGVIEAAALPIPRNPGDRYDCVIPKTAAMFAEREPKPGEWCHDWLQTLREWGAKEELLLSISAVTKGWRVEVSWRGGEGVQSSNWERRWAFSFYVEDGYLYTEYDHD